MALRESRERFREAESQRERVRERAERVRETESRESQRDREQSVFLALCVTLTTRLTGELRAGIQIVCCEQVFRADSRRNELMPADDFSRLVCQVLRT